MSNNSRTQIRTDLIRRVSEESGRSQAYCKKWVNWVLKSLGDMFVDADPEIRIELRNHGVYTIKRTSGRQQGRNPRTGEPIPIPVRRKVLYKPAKRIRKALNVPLETEGSEGPSQP